MRKNGKSGVSDRILVTGGTGFLGQHLVRRLLAEGHRVRIFARRPQQHPARRKQVLHDLIQQGAELTWGDLTNPQAVREAVQGAVKVFHLAGRLFVWGAPDHEYVHLHVDGTRNLLQACAESGPLETIVHCSSTGVLGPTGPDPVSEDAEMRPSNIYESTKADSERLACQMAEKHLLPVVIARPGLVYGPGDLHLLNWFQSIRRGFYRVVGPGDNLLHPIYVSDVVEGLLLCAGPLRTTGRVYHLVGEQPATIRQIAEQIAQSLSCSLPPAALPYPLAYGAAALMELIPRLPPEARLLTRSRVRFMTQNRVYSGERARQELGFTPKVDIKTGIDCTVAWYQKEGLL
jgi:nucleoside-diphosphate-sugar epimerase